MTLFGLVMVYSASLFIATEKHSTDWYYLVRQTGLVLVGFAVLVVGMLVDIVHYRRYAKLAMLALAVVLAAQLAFAPLIKATKRFIPVLGLTLQTSELARVATVAFVARLLANDATLGLKFSKRLMIGLTPVALLVGLTYAGRDLSAAAMIALLAALLLFLGGMEKRQFWSVTGGVSALTLTATMIVPYTRRRILGFLLPSASVSGENYQAFQSILGFGRGGIFGVGLGQGKQKMLFLPEPHTDFIYSIIGEEMGLVGAVAVLAAFLTLYVRSLRVLKNQTDRFSFLFGSGLIASLLMFALVHMGVTVGIVPVTGLPLPFISNGGSSLIVSLWSMGVMWQLSRRAGSFE